ncbi:CRTAC1 family protein [Methyloprofundus sp.]|uniref:CRTAC1 family protein n=1 Tax=Methyloprofundus sp. TaxID=2020875 RepID=UPI003D09652E
MKSILKILTLIPLTLLGIFTIVSYIKANPNPYPDSKADSEIPIYTEIELAHEHNYNGEKFLPILASAAIDIDNNGVSELFLGGGENQDDVLYVFSNNAFEPHSAIKFAKDNNDATYGASVVDINNDGLDDLLLARESGGYIYYNTGNSFKAKKIDLHLNEKSRAVSFALADINNDGHIDLYVSAYLTRTKMEGQNIFNKEGYGGSSVLLLNNGDDSFSDITEPAGMTYIHNTFLGIFVDMDDDLDLDLVVAHDTGKVKIWKNNGDLTFTDVQTPFSNVYGYPMGIGAGDYNNNGKIDFYFSNIGPTAPKFLAKGDLTDDQVFYTDLMLMENTGNMTFIDSSRKALLSDYEFSWGITMADLNLDGQQDILISENYVDLPFNEFFKLPGRMLLQKNDQTFASVESEAGVENRKYEIAPLLADFNGDGYLDQIRVNLAGKSRAFLSNGGKNKYLRVKLPSTAKMFGSKVTVTLSDGSSLTDWHISGEGLCSDQEHVLTFGLGDSLKATSVSVLMPSGNTLSKEVNSVNELVVFENE